MEMEDRIYKEETTFLDSVVFYALKNKYNKFMIPSEENYIDSIKFSKVLIDSDCSSLSIPSPINMPFDEFYNNYKCYVWYIEIYKVVGLHHRISLVINGRHL